MQEKVEGEKFATMGLEVKLPVGDKDLDFLANKFIEFLDLAGITDDGADWVVSTMREKLHERWREKPKDHKLNYEKRLPAGDK